MSDDDVKRAMQAISSVNGAPLSEERIARDLETYKSFLTAIDNIKTVTLPLESAPLPLVALKKRA